MMFSPDSTGTDSARLEDYLRAIRLRKWVVIGVGLAGFVLASIFIGSRTTTYTATATVVLGPTPVGSTNTNLVNPNLEKEREVILSNPVAEDVVQNLDLEDEPRALLRNTEVAFRPDSDVLSIDYTNTNAEVASDYANGFAESYVSAREGAAVRYYDERIALNITEINALNEDQLEVASEIEQLTRDRTQLFVEFVDVELRTGPLDVIDDQLVVKRAERGALLAEIRTHEAALRKEQSTVASRSPAAALLRTADVPSAPNGLNATAVKIAGLIFGLIGGVIAAFLLDRLDTTARDDLDVAQALGTNVMGSVPVLGFRNRSGAQALVMMSSGGSPRLSAAREAFRRLRTSLLFLGSTEDVVSVIVTSASPSEGKSTVSANMALSLAQLGKRVGLISADMRRPTQEERFGLPESEFGLSEYLGAGAELQVVEVEGVENLWVLPAGAAPANPGELLGSPRFEELLIELRSELDFVIVDTPPILSTADAIAAIPAVDAVIIVVDSSRTETSELLQVRADLERSGANLIGAVLNKRKQRSGSIFRRDRYAYYSSKKK